MSTAKKLNEAVTVTPNHGDKLLMVQDGQIKATPIGFDGQTIPMMVAIPNTDALIDGGYLPEGTPPNSMNEYLKGTLKYLSDKFPSGGLFFGKLNPGMLGFYMVFIYPSTPIKDGLPKFAIGHATLMTYDAIILFTSNNWVYKVKVIM